MNDKLMHAILSMDAYNRGYGANLNLTTSTLGTASIIKDSFVLKNPDGSRADQPVGFYAIAYNYKGQPVISYRGTDDVLGSDSDITNGWVLGGGDQNATQGNMAIQFYKSVVEGTGTTNLTQPNISLTGHSLGGGLAAYVGTLYGQNALIYDSMDYMTAARDANYDASLPVPVYTTTGQSFKDLIYNGATPWALDATGVQAYQIDGQILDNRFLRPSNPQTVDFGPAVNSQFGPLEKHSMSTMVLGIYGNDLSQKDWKIAGTLLWSTLYNDDYAQKIGMNAAKLAGTMQTDKKYSDILRTIIAYSAVDEGERPYGDTAIRALFSDANDFGKFLNTYSGTNLLGNSGFYGAKISEIMVQFSALLAVNDIERVSTHTVNSGVLAVSADTATLTVNLDDATWRAANNNVVPAILSKQALIDGLLNATSGIAATAVKTGMTELWGNNTHTAIDRIVFVNNISAPVTSSTYTGAKVNLIVGDSKADSITGTAGNDLILGGAGDDILVGGAGKDILDGGKTIIGGIGTSILGGKDTADYSKESKGITFQMLGNTIEGISANVTDASGALDKLYNIDLIKGTQFNDTFNVGDAKYTIEGGAGSDRYVLPSGNSKVTIGEKAGDAGTDVLVATGARPDNTIGTLHGTGIWVTPDPTKTGATFSFFIPNGIEQVDSSSGVYNARDYIDQKEGTDSKFFTIAQTTQSPLVIDMNGNGIELVSERDKGSVYWDIDNDGLRESSGWVKPTDALLAMDRNSNGTIDNNSELFGNVTGSPNGFTTLAQLDSNKDKQITNADTNWSKLRVWLDANSDGVSQSSELFTLDSKGIKSINLNYTDVFYQLAGNNIRQESTVAFTNNTTSKIVDAWFGYDNMNSFDDRAVTYTAKALSLPQLKSYGQLASFTAAMSQTPTLADKVEAFIAKYNPVTVNSAQGIADLKVLLWQWGGAADLTPATVRPYNSNYVEPRDLAFMEKYFGQAFRGNTGTLGAAAANMYVNMAMEQILIKARAELLGQSSAADMVYTNAPTYNPVKGGFDTVATLNIAGMQAEITKYAATDLARLETAARLFSFIKSMSGFSELSAADHTALDTLVKNTLSSFGVTYEQMKGSLVDANANYDLGIEDAPHLIIGDDNNNLMYGKSGNDFLVGRVGNEVLTGAKGDDTYYIRAGDSKITAPKHISENAGEGTDTLRLVGVLPSDVKVWSDMYTLYLRYGTEQITISGGRNMTNSANDVGNVFERIVFDNGTVWDLRNGLNMLDTDDGHELYGSNKADNMSGFGGDDRINGFDGNDILNGGKGYDNLTGGLGDDTYVFALGDSTNASQEYIYENANEGTDTIVLKGVLPANIQIWTTYNNYLHIKYSANDRFYIVGSSTIDGALVPSVERIVFDNGTVLDLTAGLTMSDVTAYGRLQGTNGNDTLYGLDGSDQLYGYKGNDTLDGGTGSDSFDGGEGNDTYIFRKGDSPTAENISERANEGTDTIRLIGILPAETKITTSGYGIELQYSLTDIVRIPFAYDSSGGLTSLVERVVFDNGTVWDLLAGFETNGTASADTLNGTQMADIINGLAGNDSLYGAGGNDTLNGGAGNDALDGSDGDDKYVYSGTGQGIDTITDSSGNDMIEFKANYNRSNVTLTRSGNYDLSLVNGSTQLMLIKDQFSYSGSIEKIKWADGTILDLLSYGFTQNGTANADSIYGINYGAGGDTINGLGGNDYIYAGEGDDIVNGGDGADYVYGDNGNDTVAGNAGDDYVYGGYGDDTYIYDSGADTFNDYGGTDTVKVTGSSFTSSSVSVARPAGNPYDLNVLLGGKLAFVLQSQFNEGYGIEGITFANGSVFDLSTVQYTTNGTSAAETLYGITAGGNPDDIMSGAGGDDYIYAYKGNDRITGGTGNDYLYGYEGNDTYVYNSGDGFDTIYERDGMDTIQLGTGYVKNDVTWKRDGGTSDLILILKGTDAIQVQGQFDYYGGIESVRLSDGTTISLSGIKVSTIGTSGNDSLSGLNYNASPDDVIQGLAGDDYIGGNGGNDTMTGGTGNDTLYGGEGDDLYIYNSGDGNDIISESSGNDVIQLGTGFASSDLTWKKVGYDLQILLKNQLAMTVQSHFYSNQGVETVKFSNGSTLSLTTLPLIHTGTASGDYFVGTDSTYDTMNGLAGADTLYGYAGNDIIDGGKDNDSLMGGTGDDTYIVRSGDGTGDMLYEYLNEGVDTLKITGGILPTAVKIWADHYNLYVRYTATDEIRISTGYTATGSTAGSYLEKISFDNGSVIDLRNAFVMTDTDDAHTMIGSALNDTLDGKGGNDSIYGFAGNDTIRGGQGNDYLYGDDGNDILFGENGVDYLTGGNGADTFVLNKASAFNNIDLIYDFKTADGDKINVADLLQGYDPVTKAITDFVEITTSGYNSILKIDADGGANNFVQVATLSSATGLTDEQALVNSGILVVA